MKNWTTQLDEITRQFKADFGKLTSTELNWKPNAQTWSVAQNMEHLIVINETYYPVIKALETGTYKPPFIAKIGFLVAFLGKTVLDAVKPDRKKKMKTFPIWEPTTGQVEGDIVQRFEEHQAELKKLIERSKDFVAKGAVISSPANRNIVYKLETAFDIIATHEQRHLEQAREVFALSKRA